jgi:GTP-binding protein
VFIDEATIHIKAGDGGNGCVSFRREKFIPRGGPNGGDGGNGGSVILQASGRIKTLLDFKRKSHLKAQPGEHGKGKNKTGKAGKDLTIKLPCGTILYDKNTGDKLVDLTEDGRSIVMAKGGRGGRGNQHFATSTRQAPRIAETGRPGEEKSLKLELKLIADVGIIGCPNAGKSTLLSRISSAHPEIASYPFTTKAPNLGVVKVGDWTTFTAADIPGLLEGAHSGTGLAGVDGRDPLDDFRKINKELEFYSKELAKRPQVVALNKMDLTEARENVERLKKELDVEVFPISGVTGEGIDELIKGTAKLLK